VATLGLKYILLNMSNALVKKTTTVTISPEAKRERNRRKRQRKAAKRAAGQRVQTVERIIDRSFGKRAATMRNFQNRGPANTGVAAAVNRLENKVRSDEQQLATVVERIFETIALPQSEGAVRISTGGAASGTMLAQATADFDVPWQNAANITGNRYYFDSSDSALVVFGDLQRGYIVYDPNATSQAWSYTINYHNYTSTGGGTTFRMNTEEWPRISGATCGTTYKPHGQNLRAAQNEEKIHLIWIDSPDGLSTVTFTGLPASQYSFRVVHWFNGEMTEPAVSFASTATFTYTVPTSGYYNFAFDESTGVVNNAITAIIAGTCSCMCHREVQDFYLNNVKINTGVVTAFSAMYTNKGGTEFSVGEIVGAQLDGDLNWMSALNLSTGAQQAPAAAATNIKILPQHVWGKQPTENGFYCFKKPNDPDEFRLKRLLENPQMAFQYGTGTQLTEPYQLDTDEPYLVILPHIPVSVGTNNTLIQAGDYVIHWCLEYGTFNSWDAPRSSNVKPSQLMDIVNAMKVAPQFHENPLHFGDIVSFVRQKILPVAASIMGSLSVVAPPNIKPFLVGGSMAAGMLSQAAPEKNRVKRKAKRPIYARP